MTEFYKTLMGHRFFEGQVPTAIHELKKLNENLAEALRLIKILVEKDAPTLAGPPPPLDEGTWTQPR
jgi:hypothetical protein